MKSFGSRELVRCLNRLKYKASPQVGSRHRKYKPPQISKNDPRPFILIMQGKNNIDPVHQKKYINKIKSHGFTEHEIEKAMWD